MAIVKMRGRESRGSSKPIKTIRKEIKSTNFLGSQTDFPCQTIELHQVQGRCIQPLAAQHQDSHDSPPKGSCTPQLTTLRVIQSLAFKIVPIPKAQRGHSCKALRSIAGLRRFVAAPVRVWPGRSPGAVRCPRADGSGWRGGARAPTQW